MARPRASADKIALCAARPPAVAGTAVAETLCMATKKRASGKRQTIRTKTATLYARRNPRGRFKEIDEKGRSLKTDRRRKANRKVKSGYGDRGDRAA